MEYNKTIELLKYYKLSGLTRLYNDTIDDYIIMYNRNIMNKRFKLWNDSVTDEYYFAIIQLEQYNEPFTSFLAKKMFKEEYRSIVFAKVNEGLDVDELEYYKSELGLIRQLENKSSNYSKLGAMLQNVNGMPISHILDCIGIEHSRGRCKSPFEEGQNLSVMSFKGNLFNDFKTGHKGNSIQFLQQLYGYSFNESVIELNSYI